MVVSFNMVLLILISTTIPDLIMERFSRFEINFNNSYQMYDSRSFLVNISTNSITKCASHCLSYSLCLTANFYLENQICSLFAECNVLGQRLSADKVLMIIKNSMGKLKKI